LEQIQCAEEELHQLGFELARVRWNTGEARLEVPLEDLERAFSMRQEISRRVKSCGFSRLSLDLDGYITVRKENN
jgi:uncharacterized protein